MNRGKLTLEERFWMKVQLGPPDQCWIWMAGKHQRGYGHFHIKNDKGRKVFFAHRISYELTYGNLSPRDEVLHSCDNTSCVNPKHLIKGTHLENMKDMINKGRHKPRIKFTRDLINLIIKSKISNVTLSKMTGVEKSYISRLKRGLIPYWNNN